MQPDVRRTLEKTGSSLRYRFDVKDHLRTGEMNRLTVAFKSPVKYAEEEFEQHKNNRYIVPLEELPEYFNGFSHPNFIR